MRIPSRKLKLLLFGFLMFFLGYFTVNFVHSGNYVTPFAHQNRPQPPLQFVELTNKLLLANEVEEKKETVPANVNNNEKEVRKKRRYLAYDGGGFGSVNRDIIKCSSGDEVEVTDAGDKFKDVDIFYFHMSLPKETTFFHDKSARDRPNYYMVYTMESEAHSYDGDGWSRADFRMWYNLDLSFPEPATYFDVNTHLIDLLAPPKVEFESKESTALVSWVVSNCGAFNGREKYMKNLMDLIPVHSFGMCLRNRFNHTNEHMKGNVDLFANYKFVIAIENSNCADYVTEKLVHAVASGSIPIVAGRDNKPDYSKFMPKNSYINIYDFKTVEELAEHLKKVGNDKIEYEKYISFKRKHNYTRNDLLKMSLTQLTQLARDIFGYEQDKSFFNGIVAKEKSENKLCKIVRYLQDKSNDRVRKEIEANRMSRPNSSMACLKINNLFNDFGLKQQPILENKAKLL